LLLLASTATRGAVTRPKGQSLTKASKNRTCVNIIDRLLFREVLKTLALVLIILLLILLASHLVKLLGKAAQGNLSPDVVLTLVGLQAIKVLGVLMPPAFFFSILWVLSGMYRDSEMVALQASGIGIRRIFRVVMTVALPVAFLAAVLMLFLNPWANSSIERIKFQQADTSDISGVRAGKFNEYRQGNLVVFAQQGSDASLAQVFVQNRGKDKLDVVLAGGATQSVDGSSGERFIVLKNGTRYQGLPGQADYAISSFGEYAIRVPQLDLGGFSLRAKAQPSALLWLSDDLKARAELQSRIAAPLAVFVFAVLAVPLARAQPRKDIYGRIVLAILVYFVFMNLQRVAERWMEVGATPAWLGMWWVSLAMLCVAGAIVLLDSHWLAAKLRAYRLRTGD